tara:strand:+ start:1320 stop:1532 length:213 start_codon:yes stop_codon:yes gene_type:complete
LKTISLIPAYGRDYNSKKEVKEAYDSGKDFRIMDISNAHDGRYASQPELKEYRQVRIRYYKLQRVMIIKQ